MTGWIKVASIEELPSGSRRVVDVDGVAVAVFNLDGDYCAIEDTCTHDGGELASGELQGEEIVCPRHGARFNLRTGAVTAPPAYGGVATFAGTEHICTNRRPAPTGRVSGISGQGHLPESSCKSAAETVRKGKVLFLSHCTFTFS